MEPGAANDTPRDFFTPAPGGVGVIALGIACGLWPRDVGALSPHKVECGEIVWRLHASIVGAEANAMTNAMPNDRTIVVMAGKSAHQAKARGLQSRSGGRER